jgi:hypothetical protein
VEISHEIDGTFCVMIDKESLCLSLRSEKSFFIHSDYYYSFARSVSVSANGLFLCIDYTFGLTEVFRVRYSGDAPDGLSRLCDFSWNANSQTVIDGKAFVCATAIQNRLVLWDSVNGRLIRMIDTHASKITTLSCDENIGAVWIAFGCTIVVYSNRGQVLGKAELNCGRISTLKVIKRSVSAMNRAAVCGCVDGSVCLLCLKLNEGIVKVKNLASHHEHGIARILVHSNRKAFVSLDVKKRAFIWTALGIGFPVVDESVYDGCGLCGNAGINGQCESCGRMICNKCKYETMCLCCAGLRRF